MQASRGQLSKHKGSEFNNRGTWDPHVHFEGDLLYYYVLAFIKSGISTLLFTYYSQKNVLDISPTRPYIQLSDNICGDLRFSFCSAPLARIDQFYAQENECIISQTFNNHVSSLSQTYIANLQFTFKCCVSVARPCARSNKWSGRSGEFMQSSFLQQETGTCT